MHWLVIFLFVTVAAAQEAPIFERTRITVNNTVQLAAHPPTTHQNAGPAVGDMLNVHFFPGLQDYSAGLYRSAETQMAYVISRPHYLEGNSRRDEYLSTAHYIRGMIFLYHATGIGRLGLAKDNLESSIKLNPRNYVGYLELARVYAELDFHDESVSILNYLLDLKPDEKTFDQARQMLEKAQAGKKP